MSADLAALVSATKEAKRALEDVKGRRRTAIDAAAAAVRVQFADEVKEAADSVIVAERAERALREEMGSVNPLIGRKVFKPATNGSWRMSDYAKPEKNGVIRMMNSNTAWPRSYGRPRPGELYIRLTKKDGSEGALVESLRPNNELPIGWKFRDGVA